MRLDGVDADLANVFHCLGLAPDQRKRCACGGLARACTTVASLIAIIRAACRHGSVCSLGAVRLGRSEALRQMHRPDDLAQTLFHAVARVDHQSAEVLQQGSAFDPRRRGMFQSPGGYTAQKPPGPGYVGCRR